MIHLKDTPIDEFKNFVTIYIEAAAKVHTNLTRRQMYAFTQPLHMGWMGYEVNF